MLAELVARILPGYLLFLGQKAYALPPPVSARGCLPSKEKEMPKEEGIPAQGTHCMNQNSVKDGSSIDVLVGSASRSVGGSRGHFLRVQVPSMVYRADPVQPSAVKSYYVSMGAVSKYEPYSSYVEVRRQVSSNEQSEGALDPKLDEKAIRRIIAQAKRDNLYGTKSYVNPVLKKKFDQWKLANDSANKIMYEFISA